MSKPEKSGSLHHLVEATYLAHKKDIRDYASGHLNPDKLVKLPVKDDFASHVPWKSSRMVDEKNENPFARIAETRKNADHMLVNKVEWMKNALLDFSVGTVGTLPETKGTKKKKIKRKKSRQFPLRGTKAENKLESLVLSEIAKLMSEPDGPFALEQSTPKPDQSTAKEEPKTPGRIPRKKYVVPYGSKYSSTLTEEIKLPELMLPAVDEAVRVPPSLKDPHPSIKQQIHEITDKKFVTTHFAGITRKDRFNKILDFDRNVLHRYETMEKNVRDGHRAADHLEQKLIRKLLELNDPSKQVNSLNFERLQAYGEVWHDLCLDSSIFGPILSETKDEYDRYLSDLLDEMKATNHTELLSCLNAANGMTGTNEEDVETLQNTVEDLEEQGRQGLLKNAELHKEIERERALIEERKRQQELEEEENRRRLLPSKTSSKKTVTMQSTRQASAKREKNTEKRLQDLRADIWERLDSISEKQHELKSEFVPKTLHRNLQHAVQDTENEMQKLMQQNEYLTKNMRIQQESLEADLAKFDSLSKENINEVLLELGVS
uniref:uncharacterized protein C6orf118-like n=1 Tax=Styela clava TaxID=7725 RepID=UPI00193948FB|nr:uncharacterized protein C6orf118-like [Styela clava]